MNETAVTYTKPSFGLVDQESAGGRIRELAPLSV
jgi:hypothetical protein